MIQEQLVEYISGQMKAGASRDSIKSTLLTAGWQAADVEDTLKKIEGSGAGNQLSATAATGASSKPMAEPQSIKMSDLIATSDPAITSAASTQPVSSASASAGSKVFTGSRPSEIKSSSMPTSFSAQQFPEKTGSSHGTLITEVILGILVVGMGALAGYLYFQNSSLNTQIASANMSTGSTSQKLASLQAAMTASTTQWSAALTTANDQSKELQTELSFYAVPPGTTTGATTTASLSGTLSGGGRALYAVMATYGAKIYISNSKDAKVIAALEPIATSTTASTFTGVYMPGADSMTLTGVNGTSL